MRTHSAGYAVTRCPPVCLSVRPSHAGIVEMAKISSKIMAYTGDLPEAERDIIKLVSSDYCIYHIFKKYLLTYLLTYLLVSKAIKHLLIALSFSACAEINLFRNFASSSAFRDPAAICALFHRGILDVLVRQNLRRGQSLDGRF